MSVSKLYVQKCDSCEWEWRVRFNFVPNLDPKECTSCDTGHCTFMTAEEAGITTNKSAALLSGVGDIHSRLPGDFRDFMQSIKDNTRDNNMRHFK